VGGGGGVTRTTDFQNRRYFDMKTFSLSVCLSARMENWLSIRHTACACRLKTVAAKQTAALAALHIEYHSCLWGNPSVDESQNLQISYSLKPFSEHRENSFEYKSCNFICSYIPSYAAVRFIAFTSKSRHGILF